MGTWAAGSQPPSFTGESILALAHEVRRPAHVVLDREHGRVGLCLTVVVGPLTDWVTALLSMVVLLGVHAWRLARCVRPLPVARRRMTMAYQRDALARAYGTGGLLALAVGSFAVASAGAVVLVSAPDQWLAASTLVASGLAAGAVLASMWPSRGATA